MSAEFLGGSPLETNRYIFHLLFDTRQLDQFPVISPGILPRCFSHIFLYSLADLHRILSSSKNFVKLSTSDWYDWLLAPSSESR